MHPSESVEQASPAPAESPCATEPPPVVVDVAYERGLLRVGWTLGVNSLFGFALAASLAVSARTISTPARPSVVALLSVVALYLAIFSLGGYAFQRRAKRLARERARSALEGDLHQQLRSILPKLAGAFVQKSVPAFAHELARAGCAGLTVRVAPSASTEPLLPIDVPFEARPLERLGVALMNTGDRPDIEALGASPTIGASMRRNVLLKGGRWLLIAFAVNVLFQAIDSIKRRTVTPGLLTWCLALAAVLFLPASRGGFTGRQWLLVPGGLVLRKSSWLRSGWNVHVFDRRRSVALLFRHWRQNWGLAVADADEFGLTIGTRQELEFALRAWLSPLSPPPVERLSDLG